MPWLDRMSKASFRGFEFLTESHSADYGRRLAVHEFPGGEQEESQDLGAKSPGWKLNAYFVGPDYDLERNALMAKLAEPGADWLTHPWLGLLWVRAHKWSLSESNKEGGYCTLTIEFVAGGGTLQPTQDMVDMAISRTRELQDVVVDVFVLDVAQCRDVDAKQVEVQLQLGASAGLGVAAIGRQTARLVVALDAAGGESAGVGRQRQLANGGHRHSFDVVELHRSLYVLRWLSPCYVAVAS